MIIRAYAHLPVTYAADVGEVIYARRSGSDPWARAVVVTVSRRYDGGIRYAFVWLETVKGTSAVQGKRGNVYVHKNRPPLIKQIDRGQSPDG